jgi:peptidoglycan/LPS O-acetylase OafA/YrhL
MEVNREFKVNNFDLLRLIAATQVIIDHYFQHLKIPLSRFGLDILYLFPGVPVFFVISGYLISASFERNNSLRTYIRNRALRIYPGLWGCIFLTIIVIGITGISFFNKQVITWLPAQLTGLIYTPPFLKDYGFGSYNGSLWTIPIELQFYILLPLCYSLAPKKKLNLWFYGLLAVFMILYVTSQIVNLGERTEKLLTYSFIPHFYLFLTGVLFQRLQLYKFNFIYNKALYWVVGYVLFSLLLSNHMNLTAFLLIKNIILAFCLLSMAYTLPTMAKKLLHTNDISYGIYIYHGLILTVAVQLKVAGATPQFLLSLIGLTCILAYLSWRFIEKPFLRNKKKTIRVVTAE